MNIVNIDEYMVSIELDRVDGGLKYYDAVLSKGDKEIKIHKGCMGEKSGQYWGKKLELLAKKLVILNARKDMAQNNMACYGGSIKPLDRWKDEWEAAKEEVEFIEHWIVQLVGRDD